MSLAMPQAGHGYCLYPVQKSLPFTPGQKQHGWHKEAVRAQTVPSHLPSLTTAASPLPQPDQGIRAVKAEAESVAIPLCWLYALGHVPLMRLWNHLHRSPTSWPAWPGPQPPLLLRCAVAVMGPEEHTKSWPFSTRLLPAALLRLGSTTRSEWAPETPRPVGRRGRSVSVRLAGLCQDKGSGRAGQPSSLAYPQNWPGGARLCLQGSEIPCLACSAHAGEAGSTATGAGGGTRVKGKNEAGGRAVGSAESCILVRECGTLSVPSRVALQRDTALVLCQVTGEVSRSMCVSLLKTNETFVSPRKQHLHWALMKSQVAGNIITI